MRPRDSSELGEEGAAQASALELVDHRHRDLGNVRTASAVVARHADDSLLSARPVRRGDDREAVVVIDNSQAMREGIRHPLDGREEAEIDGALGHRGDRLVEE